MKVEALKQCLRDIWQVEVTTSDWPEDVVRRLLDEKYSKVEWIRRR
jgi:hypothetical protein